MVTNNFVYLNSGLMVKDLFCKHGGDGSERFKPSH